MKLKYIFTTICCTLLFFTGCTDDEGRVVYPDSTPKISNVLYSVEDYVEATDSVFISLEVKDEKTPLSTLEVSLVRIEKDSKGVEMIGEELFSESIRTKGNSFKLEDYGMYVPFNAMFDEGEAELLITAINVEGNEAKESKTFTLKRPSFPETLYLHYDGNVLPMVLEENDTIYATAKSEYPEKLTGKISTSESLEDSRFVWGLSEVVNEAEIGSAFGGDFSFDYTDWTIDKITFNIFDFTLGVEGKSQIFIMNDVTLLPSAGFYFAYVEFEQGAIVETSNFDDLEGAYNRDFFDYNTETGELTFLRESGEWEVYYSMEYNYMWVVRSGDVGPRAYWLTGHGFLSTPRWYSDFSAGGWTVTGIPGNAYVVRVSDNIYQTTVYLTTEHEWGSFEFQIHSGLDWEIGMYVDYGAITGDNAETFHDPGDNNGGLDAGEGFVPGYYRLTFDTSSGVENVKLKVKLLE